MTGIPIWMSLKCRVPSENGKHVFGTGLFGFSGRCNKKIAQKQLQIIQNIPQAIKKGALGQGFDKHKDFVDLLEGMLAYEPSERISPKDAISHPFMN